MSGESFHDFEKRGWQNAAEAYQRSWISLTGQAVPHLLEACGVRAGTALLDIATGPGVVAAAAHALGAMVTGVDFSARMVEDARLRYPDIEFLEGDAEDLDFPDSTFDAACMNFGMLHLERPERAMSEALRVLKAGGRFAFTVWDAPERAVAFGITLDAIRHHGQLQVPMPTGPPFFRFSEEVESIATLRSVGFVSIQFRTIPQAWLLRSPDDLFEIMINGTVRTAALLAQQSASALAEIRKEMHRRCLAYITPDGVTLPMPAVLAAGTKVLT